MQIGKMDRLVTIQSPTIARGDIGGPVETWSDLATVWANVRDLNGREIFAAQAAGSAVSKVVTIWYRGDVTAKHRVRFADGSIARISHVREVQRKKALELYCEVVNG